MFSWHSGRLSKNPVLQVIAWTYIWAFRSIPLIVQLLFWFNITYLYQTLSLGIPFGPEFFTFQVSGVIGGFTAAVIGLALHQAAYSAEIIRSGIISVDHGQIEAAHSLGIPRSRQFFKIVLPQAMRAILPNAANEVIGLFKGTSIVSTMAIAELFLPGAGHLRTQRTSRAPADGRHDLVHHPSRHCSRSVSTTWSATMHEDPPVLFR